MSSIPFGIHDHHPAHHGSNPNFPNRPVNLVVLKTDIDGFSALMAEALDGSKRDVAEKNKQRDGVIKKLRLLGRYAEVTCKDDLAIFQSS